MELKIINVYGHGDFNKEHVVLQAVSDCDAGRYMLADSTFLDSGSVSNKVRHTFWIPDRDVKAGDYISIWTKPGTNNKGTYRDCPLHRFFWGLNRAVWNDEGDCAVLFHVATWQFFPTH